MSTEHKRLVTSLMGAVAVLLMLALVIWPQYSAGLRINREIASIQTRVERLDETDIEVRELEALLEETRSRQKADLKIIPPSSDLPSLISRLTRVMNEQEAKKQVFSTGRPYAALNDPESALYVTPLTIELSGSFHTAFNALRSSETLDRMIRTASVRMQRDPDDEGLVKSTIVLEAVYADASLTKGDQ